MRITITSLVILVAGSCSTAAAPSLKRVVTPTASSGQVAVPPNLCYPTGVPRSVTASMAHTGTCRTLPTKSRQTLRAELNKRFRPSRDGAKLRAEYGCNPLGDTITEVVFERGSGHGFSLELWRMTRSKDGKSYNVHGLAFADSRRGDDPQNIRPVTKVARAVVSARLVDPHLEAIVAGLTVTLREVAPPPKANMGLGMRGFGSSNDFHVLVRLRDASGYQIQGQYTGYSSSGAQLRYLPLVVISEPLHHLVENIKFKESSVTNEDRAHFAERLADGQSRFDNNSTWWVMERQVSMARSFGSPSIIPILLTRLSPKKRDRSSVDTERNAIEAIAEISGWDVRRHENGRKRAVEDVARDYLKECGRAME